MGSVWVAKHVELDVDVAVKLISWVQALKPVAVERFKREARAAAQIRSPHVVQILDYGVHEGVPYMAMELLSGQDLSEYLEAAGAVAPKRLLEILRPTVKALALAHQAGIVHRDIKPANIYLARVGDDEVVKVLDFGIAKETSREAKHTTGTGLVGSPLYMSPEQMKGSDVDAQSDLWSLAVVLHEALCGEPPYDAPSLPQLFHTVSHKDAPPISSVVPELAREKTERFANVRELLAAFEQAVAVAPDFVAPKARERDAATSISRSAGHTAFEATRPLGASAVTAPPSARANVETLDALADLPSSAELARPRANDKRAKPGMWIAIGVGATLLVGIGAATSGVLSGLMTSSSSPTASPAPDPTGDQTANGAPGQAAPDVAVQEPAAPPATAEPIVSAAASASASAPAVTPGAPGPVVKGGQPRPPVTSQPASTPSARPPAADPIWGVPVSQPKR